MQNNECKNSEFKVWTWKNPVMLHWIINPGLAINELILGQRVPKIILIEKHSSKILKKKLKSHVLTAIQFTRDLNGRFETMLIKIGLDYIVIIVVKQFLV